MLYSQQLTAHNKNRIACVAFIHNIKYSTAYKAWTHIYPNYKPKKSKTKISKTEKSRTEKSKIVKSKTKK